MEAQSSGLLAFLRRSPDSTPQPGGSLPLPADHNGASLPAAQQPLRSRSSLSALLPAWPALGRRTEEPGGPQGTRRLTVSTPVLTQL